MMKNTLGLGLLAGCIVLASVTATLAQVELKVGYIDSQRILTEYRGMQDIERIYTQELDAWKAQAQTMEREIVKLQDELRAQALMLSEEKQREKKLDLDKKVADYQRFMKDIFSENGTAAQRNRELTQPIMDKINRILETMSEKQGYTLVFDIVSANIVYADKNFDLTDTVLEELNKLGR